MRRVRSLVIDNFVASIASDADSFGQTYGYLNENKPQRKMDGASYLQVQWGGKLTTQIIGGGTLPEGITAYGLESPRLPHTMKCLSPLSVQSVSNAILLPISRRRQDDPDLMPGGYAIMPKGHKVASAISDYTGDTLTITPVTGAVSYELTYWPILMVWLTSIKHSGDMSKGAFQWSIEAEEV